jgi:hypothetical protein
MITQEQLKEKLIYFSKEGYFIRLPLGNVAGYNENGYVKLKIKGKAYFAHRLAWLYMTGEMPKNCIDHINGIKHDNRFSNLRECTRQQNNLNVPLKANNKSGYKGVSWFKPMKKWRATGYLNKKSIHLGYFTNPEDAHNEYKKFIDEHHKEFGVY